MPSYVTYLQANNNRVQVEHWLPVFSQDVQTDVAFQINVRVVDLLRALDFRWIVRKVLVDLEVEVEAAALVHALVRVDCELEVQNVVGVGEVRLHRGPEG